jgi:4-carboxymuconolactone decarboxylase
MNRILEIPPEKLTRADHDLRPVTAGRGRILGPYKIWIHSPPVESGMERRDVPQQASSLSKREVEIAILVIAQHWQADYVRQAHIREGKVAGSFRRRSTRSSPAASPRSPTRTSDAVHRFAAALVSASSSRTRRFAGVNGWEETASPSASSSATTSVALAMKVHEVPVPSAPRSRPPHAAAHHACAIAVRYRGLNQSFGNGSIGSIRGTARCAIQRAFSRSVPGGTFRSRAHVDR